MTLFWLLAAALIALALAFVLPPLMRAQTPNSAPIVRGWDNVSILREQLAQLHAELAAGELTAQQHAQACNELQRRALDEEQSTAATRAVPAGARSAVLFAIAIPALAMSLYGVLGNTDALRQPVAASSGGTGEVTQAQIEAMVVRLAQRLESAPADQPADPQGWEMLARSYASLQRFPEASRAYKRATELSPRNAQLLADHADVLAMMQGQNAEGEPMKLIDRALAIEPDNVKALALAGSAAFARNDFAAAVKHWDRAQAAAPAGSEFAKSLASSAAEASKKLGVER